MPPRVKIKRNAEQTAQRRPYAQGGGANRANAALTLLSLINVSTKTSENNIIISLIEIYEINKN